MATEDVPGTVASSGILANCHPARRPMPQRLEASARTSILICESGDLMAIPDPTAMASNLVQIEDARRRWQEQARDSEARANAALLAEVNGLVDAMNAYAKGYRLLSGELQDFRPDWSRAQRQQAATDYRAWIDPREVSERIQTHLRVLTELQAGSANLDDAVSVSLDRLVSVANGFVMGTVYPLLNAKESDEDRARVVDALMLARSTERARPVVDWVGRTRPYLRHGAEDLRTAGDERAALTTRLTALHHFTALPPDNAQTRARPSWYKRLTGLFRRHQAA